MTTVRRADLEDVPVSFPGYLVDAILPYLERPQQAGTMYYQKYKADIAAQYGRATATLGAITANTLGADDITFACKEVLARYQMGYDQIAGYASQDFAELAMARMAKRAFYNKIEQLAADALLKSDSTTDVSADLVAGIEAEAAKLADTATGPVALALSFATFAAIRKNAAVADRMKNTGVVVGAGGDPRAVTAEQLAVVLGVSKVLVGTDAIWKVGVTTASKTYEKNAALVILPDKTNDPAEEVQLGRTVYFGYDSADRHFKIEQFWSDASKADVIDAVGQVDLKVLNPELAKTLKVLA